MAYQMAATAVTLNDFGGHSPVARLFKSNPLNICAAFYMNLTDSDLILKKLAHIFTKLLYSSSFSGHCLLRPWPLTFDPKSYQHIYEPKQIVTKIAWNSLH